MVDGDLKIFSVVDVDGVSLSSSSVSCWSSSNPITSTVD